MRTAKRILIALLIAVLAAFFHYYLPQHDTVRIVGTDVKRMDVEGGDTISEGDGAPVPRTRDVRFINAFWPDGEKRVYRNEETGWGFPWYFKFDSANLQAEAQNLISTADNPKWVNVTFYGWRIEILSMFPNAVGLRQVAGPDYRPFPWFNITFFVLLTILVSVLWVFLVRFKRRHIDPLFNRIDDEVADATEAVDDAGRRTKRWLEGWRHKKRPRAD